MMIPVAPANASTGPLFALLCGAWMLWLSGCAGQPAASPKTTIAIPASPPGGAGEDSAILGRWWTLYQDPGLNDAVDQALVDNRDLRTAAARLLEARAQLSEARREPSPGTVVAADAGEGSTLQDQIEAADQHSDRIRTGPRVGLGADVLWEVDVFGRLKSWVKAARADTDAARADEDGVRIMIAADVTRAWLAACGGARRVEVAQAALSLAERGRDLADKLRLAGAGAASDVVRADKEVAEVRATIPPLEARRRDALVELAVLTGRPPPQAPAAAAACSRLPTLKAMPVFSDGLSLLRRRPDVRQAERRLAASTARIGMAIGDLYPRISLGADLASSAYTPAQLANRGDVIWRIGPMLSWSVPNIAQARARLLQARAREAGALARLDDVILTALKEVNQSGEDYHAALHRQEALRIVADRTREAARLSRLGRAAGAATALEALDAERLDLEAQQALAAADADVANAEVVLFKALGGGWETGPRVTLPVSGRASSVARATSPSHP